MKVYALYNVMKLTVYHFRFAKLYVKQDVFFIAVFINDADGNRLSENNKDKQSRNVKEKCVTCLLKRWKYGNNRKPC